MVNQIQRLESACPSENQPDWYQEQIRQLQQRALVVQQQYEESYPAALVKTLGSALVCGIAAIPALP